MAAVYGEHLGCERAPPEPHAVPASGVRVRVRSGIQFCNLSCLWPQTPRAGQTQRGSGTRSAPGVPRCCVLGSSFLKNSGAARRRCDWPRSSNLYANEAAQPPRRPRPVELASKEGTLAPGLGGLTQSRAGRDPRAAVRCLRVLAQKGRLTSLVAPSPCLPSRPSPSPACPRHLPPRPALKGVLGFLRFLMNPGWAARKMWGRDVRRPAASPASPSSPSWAGALPRHRGSQPGGQPGNAACLCPRRRRSWTKAGKRRVASAQIRTAPRSQALSTIPPSLSLAWVRIARRRESGPECA